MQLATEVGFAPPVLAKSTIYGSEDPELEKLRGSLWNICCICTVCGGLVLTSASIIMLTILAWRTSAFSPRL